MRVDRAIICAMRTGMTSVMTGFIVAACGRALRRGRCPTAVATMVFEVADAPFLGRTGQRPDFANLGTAGPLLGLGDGPRGVDQPDVAERLREVADHLAVAGVDLLGQQPDIVDGGHATLEGHGGRLDLTAGQCRADQLPRELQLELRRFSSGALPKPLGDLYAIRLSLPLH